MKTIIKTAAILLLINPIFLSANEESTGPYISLGYNWFNFDDLRGVQDEDDLYFGLGFQATENVGIEFKHTNFGAKYTNASMVYRHNPRSENSFFWKAGMGKYTDLATGESNFSLGAGYELHFDNSTSFTLGVDGLRQFGNGAVDWVPYVGLNYFFGETKKKVVKVAQKPAAVDSDNDGIIDNLDQCPNSPAGVTVNSRGCEVDSDNDGVVDSRDQCSATPAGAKVDEKGCRIVLTEDVSIALNVQFANNSNEVTSDYRDEIKKVADFMKSYPDTNVVIEGHTDSRGAASYNQSLSQKRANAVMAYIVSEFDIEQNRISAVGKGEVSPIADNETSEGRAKNRRVQAEIKTSVSKPQ